MKETYVMDNRFFLLSLISISVVSFLGVFFLSLYMILLLCLVGIKRQVGDDIR